MPTEVILMTNQKILINKWNPKKPVDLSSFRNPLTVAQEIFLIVYARPTLSLRSYSTLLIQLPLTLKAITNGDLPPKIFSRSDLNWTHWLVPVCCILTSQLPCCQRLSTVIEALMRRMSSMSMNVKHRKKLLVVFYSIGGFTAPFTSLPPLFLVIPRFKSLSFILAMKHLRTLSIDDDKHSYPQCS